MVLPVHSSFVRIAIDWNNRVNVFIASGGIPKLARKNDASQCLPRMIPPTKSRSTLARKNELHTSKTLSTRFDGWDQHVHQPSLALT